MGAIYGYARVSTEPFTLDDLAERVQTMLELARST
jgi:DNA-binding transcriptional regulator GbsR (MarR family)